jgi:PAS domain S-box-containing protein
MSVGSDVLPAPRASTAAFDTIRRQLQWFERADRFIAVLAGPDLVFDFANAAYVRLAGGRELIGKTVREAFPELRGLGVYEILDGVVMTGRRYVARQMPVTLVNDGRADLRVLDFLYEPILGPDGKVVGVLVDGVDMTDSEEAEGVRQIQRRESLLAELSERFRDVEDPADLSYAAAELLGSRFAVSRAGYGTIDVARETITIERDWNAPGIRTIAGVLKFRDYGTYIEDLKRGETVVCADAFMDPRTAPRAEALKGISAQAFVNMPVSEQGGLVALLYLNHAEARVWSPEELALIREVAERTRVAVERRRAEMALREREADLKAALDAGSLAPFDFDHATRLMAPSAPLNALYGYPADHVMTLEDMRARYHPDDREAFLAEARAHQNAPELKPFTWQLRLLLPDGHVRWIEGRGEYARDESGRIARSRGVIMDITERKKAEERQRLLVSELDHRVKNTLAIVQGLAQQSFRGQSDPDRGRAAFEARLAALAAAHNLLTRNSWTATSMGDLVESCLAAPLGDQAARVALQGPAVQIAPQTAVSIALALHELCTNALKYGALSAPDGRVEVRWAVHEGEEQRRFRLHWRERGGPPVAPPASRGFGSRMIERGLAAELGGHSSLTFDPAGVEYEIDAPLPTA